MPKDETKQETDQEETTDEPTYKTEIEKLEEQRKETNQQITALRQKHTFKGLYKRVMGKESLMRSIKANDRLDKQQKYDTAIKGLKAFAESL